MRRMDEYVDHWGYLVYMPSEDGRDSALMTGFNRYLRYLKFKNDKNKLDRETAKLNQEIDGLKDSRTKLYSRHPDKSQLWGKPQYFTHDQHRALTIASGALGLKTRVLELCSNVIKNFFRYQDKNFIRPHHLAEFIRSIWMLGGLFKLVSVLYPLVFIGDLYMYIVLLTAKHSVWQEPDYAEDENTIMHFLQANEALPTPASYLLKKYYLKHRPLAGYINADRSVSLRSLKDKRDLTGAESSVWWKYHESNEGPPFFENYFDVIRKELR